MFGLTFDHFKEVIFEKYIEIEECVDNKKIAGKNDKIYFKEIFSFIGISQCCFIVVN